MPSSSVSAHIGNSGKHKAHDDNVSMASALGPSGSVVSVASGASSASRKCQAMQKDQELSKLHNNINSIQSTFQTNTDFMCTFQARFSQPMAPGPAPLDTMSDAVEQKKKARSLLLWLDSDFLSSEELVMLFDLFGLNDDAVEAYIVLASADNMAEVWHSWLKKQVTEASKKIT